MKLNSIRTGVRRASLAALMVAAAGCETVNELTELEVINQNNPERERALALAKDVESLIGSSLLIWWQGTHYSSPSWALSTAADEATMSWGNFGMQQLSSEPRVAWPNSPAWTYRAMTENPWYLCYEALSAVYDGFSALKSKPELAQEIDTTRAKAFGRLVQGMAHGWLAMMFDSAFIFDETVNLEADVLELKPYPDVFAAAVKYVKEAIALATAPGVSFRIPDAWFDGNPMTNTELAQFAYSWLARMTTQVARTPEERAAVNWNEVIQYVDRGITRDIWVDGRGAFERFWKSLEWYGFQTTNNTWARADYKTIGWTDKSGRFAQWLATPVAQRNEFLLETDDKRITASATQPNKDGTDFKYHGPSRFPAVRGTYHYSFYGGKRFDNYPKSNATVPARFMTTVEMQLIKAEGLLRTQGPSQAVADIINATRVTRGGLPPALATESIEALMDKLIYEKRIEGYLLCSGCAYFDRRGFGPLAPTGPNFHHGLVEGTPLHFAPPGKELEVLQKPIYTYGGKGNEGRSLSGSRSPGLMASRSTTVPAWRVYAFRDLGSTAEKLAHVRRKSEEFSPGTAALAGLRYH